MSCKWEKEAKSLNAPSEERAHAWPTGHGVHVVAPMAENVPAAHTLHELLPGADAAVPAGQDEMLPLMHMWPTGHVWGVRGQRL